MLTPAQIATLRTEIVNDPTARGYKVAAVWKTDQEIADLLNAPGTGAWSDLLPGTVRRTNITPQEVLEAIDSRDYIATPSALAVAWYESATQLARIRLVNDDGTNTRALGNLRRVLEVVDTQGSRARLDAIANRNTTRAESLLGRDIVVQQIEVARADGRG